MTKVKKEKLDKQKETKARFVKAGYCDPKTKWYWDKDEKVWCLPLKPIVL